MNQLDPNQIKGAERAEQIPVTVVHVGETAVGHTAGVQNPYEKLFSTDAEALKLDADAEAAEQPGTPAPGSASTNKPTGQILSLNAAIDRQRIDAGKEPLTYSAPAPKR